MRFSFLFLILFSTLAWSQSANRQIKSLQIIKFDNYDDVEGEQILFDKRFDFDSTGKKSYLKPDLKWALENLKFPHQRPVFYQSDTASTLKKSKKQAIVADSLINSDGSVIFVSDYAPVLDEKGRIIKYNAGKNIHYGFEYTSSGYLRYIKRYGAKHVTAQVTFIYQFY